MKQREKTTSKQNSQQLETLTRWFEFQASLGDSVEKICLNSETRSKRDHA